MNPEMYLLLNHPLHEEQKSAARRQFGVTSFQLPPRNIKLLWSGLPPEAHRIKPVLEPVFDWLGEARTGDIVLVQGDFGACFLVAGHCLAHRLVPVYATTNRRASEKHLEDGTVKMTHHFKHVIFRRYGE